MQTKCRNNFFLQLILPGILLVPMLEVSDGLYAAAQTLVKATALHFSESEAGIDPFPVRYLVSERYLRIDEGRDDNNFILFDKTSKIIYSVAQQNRMIMKIEPRVNSLPAELVEKQKNLKLSETKIDDAKLPEISGHNVESYELRSDETVCAQVSAARGLLPEVVAMLGLYESVLARNNGGNLGNQPPEYMSDCMLLTDVFAAGAYLKFGFPVVWDKKNGSKRFLLNFEKEQEIDAKLFEVPDDYRVFELEKPQKP